MKNLILFLSILLVTGLNAQTKKKSTTTKKKPQTTAKQSNNSIEKEIEYSIYLVCSYDNTPSVQIVDMEQTTEYLFLGFYPTGKLVVLQGPNANTAINRGPQANGSWSVTGNKITVSYWSGTSNYIKASSGKNLKEDEYGGRILRFLDKF